MQVARHLLAQRHIALWLCVATLILRLLVPSGYMVGNDHGHVAILVCPGVAGPAVAEAMPHHMAGGQTGHHRPAEHDRVDQPCAFAGLSAAMLGAIDPILLIGLIAFILRLGFVATRRTIPSGFRHARPPLRGPPALA